jgi:hypothetical protein
VVTASDDGTARIWDVTTGKTVMVLKEWLAGRPAARPQNEGTQ